MNGETACFFVQRENRKGCFCNFSECFPDNSSSAIVKITKSPETVMVSGLLTVVRGTGLELTRRHVTLGRPVSKSTASKTSIEVVRVRQR